MFGIIFHHASLSLPQGFLQIAGLRRDVRTPLRPRLLRGRTFRPSVHAENRTRLPEIDWDFLDYSARQSVPICLTFIRLSRLNVLFKFSSSRAIMTARAWYQVTFIMDGAIA